MTVKLDSLHRQMGSSDGGAHTVAPSEPGPRPRFFDPIVRISQSGYFPPVKHSHPAAMLKRATNLSAVALIAM